MNLDGKSFQSVSWPESVLEFIAECLFEQSSAAGKYYYIKRLCREGPSPHLHNFFAFFYSQEHFLVPDHTITDITGASFAGFYYVCLQKSAATIEGYYYHRSSEWYVVILVVMSIVAILM